MNALDITGKDGRPAPVTDTLVVLTAGVSELLERGAGGDGTLKSDLMRVALPRIKAGGRAARLVPGWTATSPMDDPANEPDIWTRTAAPIVWIKRDDHEPDEPDAAGTCSWCGRRHTGVMAVFTVLLPEEY
jgi:hypothetical protein